MLEQLVLKSLPVNIDQAGFSKRTNYADLKFQRIKWAAFHDYIQLLKNLIAKINFTEQHIDVANSA